MSASAPTAENLELNSTTPFTVEELFDEFLRVILKGPYFLTQTLLPLLADGPSTTLGVRMRRR